MSIEIKVPMLPESVTEAVVAVWHKSTGDICQLGDVLLELETDKVMLEVVATDSGKLLKQCVEVGAVVHAQDVLAQIDETAEIADEVESAEDKEASSGSSSTAQVPVSQEKVADKGHDGFINASPSVRREVHEKNINVSTIKPSGRGGRYVSEDLSVCAQSKRVPMSMLRKKIAERLVSAQHTAAMLTTFNEVDMGPIMQLRSENQPLFQEKYDVKLGFMSFFVQAVTHALEQFPEVNASVDGDDIIYHMNQHIGIAVSTERGLVVPVLKHAESMGYADIEIGIRDYAQKARAGKLTLDDMTGGTFTITNGGVFGSLLSTPILNMPQSAILGMHSIQKRPVVVDDEIVIKSMMYLALSYDHRLVDGKQSVQFLVTVKDMLENPNRLLLDL